MAYEMYSSKSQFPPPNDTSEVEEIPLYTEDGDLFKCGIQEPDPEACLYEPLTLGMRIVDPGIVSCGELIPMTYDTPEIKEESEIYNEVIEWLELEHDEYLEEFDRDKLLSYCVAIENE
jgi:hypothetical protein